MISPRISKRREVGSVSSDLPPSMIRNTALLRHSFPTSPNPSLRRKVRGTFVHSFLVNFNKKAQSLREAYHIMKTKCFRKQSFYVQPLQPLRNGLNLPQRWHLDLDLLSYLVARCGLYYFSPIRLYHIPSYPTCSCSTPNALNSCVLKWNDSIASLIVTKSANRLWHFL